MRRLRSRSRGRCLSRTATRDLPLVGPVHRARHPHQPVDVLAGIRLEPVAHLQVDRLDAGKVGARGFKPPEGLKPATGIDDETRRAGDFLERRSDLGLVERAARLRRIDVDMDKARGPDVLLARLLVQPRRNPVHRPVDVEPVRIDLGGIGQCLLEPVTKITPMHAHPIGMDVDEVDLVEALEQGPGNVRIKGERCHQNGTSFSQTLRTSAQTEA